MNEGEVVDLWLGRCPSAEAVDRYFQETYSDDDIETPISEFAADMGLIFYDHDLMERGFRDTPTASVAEALAGHSFSSSYVLAAADVLTAKQLPMFNVVVLVWGCEIERPRSVARPPLFLDYVGRFRCDPDAEDVRLHNPPVQPGGSAS